MKIAFIITQDTRESCQTPNTSWRKYPDHLSGDYALRSHPVREGSTFIHEALASHP